MRRNSGKAREKPLRFAFALTRRRRGPYLRGVSRPGGRRLPMPKGGGGGKSGLHGNTMPDNLRPGSGDFREPEGKRHRKQTPAVRRGKGERVG
jgi:hypothetical protein